MFLLFFYKKHVLFYNQKKNKRSIYLTLGLLSLQKSPHINFNILNQVKYCGNFEWKTLNIISVHLTFMDFWFITEHKDCELI